MLLSNLPITFHSINRYLQTWRKYFKRHERQAKEENIFPNSVDGVPKKKIFFQTAFTKYQTRKIKYKQKTYRTKEKK